MYKLYIKMCEHMTTDCGVHLGFRRDIPIAFHALNTCQHHVPLHNRSLPDKQR